METSIAFRILQPSLSNSLSSQLALVHVLFAHVLHHQELYDDRIEIIERRHVCFAIDWFDENLTSIHYSLRRSYSRTRNFVVCRVLFPG